MDETVEAEAVVNSIGQLVGFKIRQAPANVLLASDLRLEYACRDAFSDPVPPASAAARDARVHFIIRVTIRTQPVPTGNAYWVQMEAGML